jgi:hypothetical protein
MIKRICLAFVFSVLIMNLFTDGKNLLPTGAEYTTNVIQTIVPFLTIAPDSRGGAMGDAGAATTPDINSLHWNGAKYAFINEEIGVSLSYSPWLKGIANDIKLLYLTGFKRIDKQQVVAAGVRFFNLGQIVFTDEYSHTTGQKIPTEFTLEAAYSRLFTDRFSGGITFRFVRSDLSTGAVVYDSGLPSKAGISFAADVSVYYHKPVQLSDVPGEWALGINISNIGTKMSYADDQKKLFIPTNLKIGGSITMNLDQYNKLSLTTDLNKLLVPTPPLLNDSGQRIGGENPDVSVAQGMIQSFYDAPKGFSEELKEITISIGGEYWYREQFALRAGYFSESAMKGNRKYFTLGLGIKMNVLTVDFSYLLPAAYRNNPLANTMRLTASFNIGKPKKQQNKK